MAWKNMDVAPVNEGVQTHFAYEASETLTAAGNGTSFIIPDEVYRVAVTVSFTGGAQGLVQATTSTVASVKAATAVWVNWPSGTVSATTQNVCDPVTAVRSVQSAPGTMKIEIRGQ